MFIDNQSTICLSKSEAPTGRSKHISIKYHILNAAIENEELKPEYVPSEDNLVDIFTKALAAEWFVYHCHNLLVPIISSADGTVKKTSLNEQKCSYNTAKG